MNFMMSDENQNTKLKTLMLFWLLLVSFLVAVNGAPTPTPTTKSYHSCSSDHPSQILKKFEAEHVISRTQLWSPTVLQRYDFKRIDYSKPSHNQAQECRVNRETRIAGLTNTSVTSEKSLCPWVEDRQNRDFDQNRFPQYIPRITCICDNCIGFDHTEIDGKSVRVGCRPVHNNRFVLYKRGARCWELGVVGVPVGCACSNVTSG